MDHLDGITVNTNPAHGRLCIRGMRIRVIDVLDLLASRIDQQEMLQDYPYIENEDITAAPAYAALQLEHPVLQVA
jgi:uncharacterized protein (DUF433 family)